MQDIQNSLLRSLLSHVNEQSEATFIRPGAYKKAYILVLSGVDEVLQQRTDGPNSCFTSKGGYWFVVWL